MALNCRRTIVSQLNLKYRTFFLFKYILLISLHYSRITTAKIHASGVDFDSMPAVFGQRWYTDVEYEAQLKVIPNNVYLCTQGDYPINNSLQWNHQTWWNERTSNSTGKIHTRSNQLPVALLVSRGGCSFEEKARTAMTLKVNFLIVYDDRVHNRLVPMSASYEDDIDIGLMFVSHDTGLELRHMLREASRNRTVIDTFSVTMDGELPYYYSAEYEADDIQEWILAMMSGFFALLASVGCILTCMQAGFIPTDGHYIFSSKRRMTEEQVLKLDVVNFGTSEDRTEQSGCPICLEEYEEGECLRQLPCGHKFHTECIIPWLKRHSICPLCKVEVSLPSSGARRSPIWSSFGICQICISSRDSRRMLVPNIDLDEESEIDDDSESSAFQI